MQQRLLSSSFKAARRAFSATPFSLELQVSVQPLEEACQHVSVLKLNRPAAKNALGRQLIQELQAALDIVRQEQSTRCLIISSEVAGVFSAGADLKVCARQSPSR